MRMDLSKPRTLRTKQETMRKNCLSTCLASLAALFPAACGSQSQKPDGVKVRVSPVDQLDPKSRDSAEGPVQVWITLTWNKETSSTAFRFGTRPIDDVAQLDELLRREEADRARMMMRLRDVIVDVVDGRVPWGDVAPVIAICRQHHLEIEFFLGPEMMQFLDPGDGPHPESDGTTQRSDK